MKYSIVIIFILFISINAGTWSDIEQLTNSDCDNQNLDLISVFSSGTDISYIAWEQSVDDFTTKIVFSNLNSDITPQTVLFESGVHFKSPKFSKCYENTSGKTSLFYLFYETNKNGNTDIYYLKYYEDGTFSEPIPFFNTEDNENSLNGSVIYWPQIVWESNGSIFHSEYFSTDWASPQLIDGADCYTPDISSTDFIVAYLKNIDDSLKVYYAEQNDYTNYNVLFDEGTSSNLSFCKGNYCTQCLTWQNLTDSISQVYFNDFDLGEDKIEEFPNLNKYQPTVYDLPPPMSKNTSYDMMPLMAFVLDTAGYHQIYANDDCHEFHGFYNVAVDSTMNRNPQLFEGKPCSEGVDVILIWESLQDGHWQLQMRSNSQWIPADIEDLCYSKTKKYKLFQNYPNPFNPKTKIEYFLPKTAYVRIEIYNTLGQLISIAVDSKKYPGHHSVFINAKQLNSGIYFYRIKTDQFSQIKKMTVIK